MKLEGSTFSAEFDCQLNNFVSLKSKLSGDDYIKGKPKFPLISLFTWINDEKKELLPGLPEIIGGENELKITYREFSGYAVDCCLTIIAKSDEIEMNASIENKDPDLTVTEIMMPHLSNIYLGQSYEDDMIIYPHHAGEKTVNPIMEYGPNRKEFFRASSIPVDDFYRREINYCGLASMSWMYYYDNENGLYLGSHDPRFPVTGVIAETSGKAEDPWMAFCFRKYHRIEEGTCYKTGSYIIGITEKDWHEGANKYRSYIEPYLDLAPISESLKKEYALNQCYNFKRSGKIEHTFDDIPQMFETGMAFGVHHIFIAGWNRTGFDSFYPEFYPDLELGSALTLSRGLEAVREKGGLSTLYINARLFDVKSDFHPSLGEKMALRNANGEMIYETYGSEHFTVNCPSDSLWKHFLLDTAEFMVKSYGCDGVYLDQLASAEPFACYAELHDHEHIEQFNQGYVDLLRELLQKVKAIRPSSFLMTENCGDIYSCFTAFNLTWNAAEYDEYFNVFKYTFPEFIQVNMINPRANIADEKTKLDCFFSDIQRATLLGSVFWVGLTDKIKKDSIYESYVKQVLQFRNQIQCYLHDAIYLDDHFIDISVEGCEASCWQLDNGYLVLAGNKNLLEDATLICHLPIEIENIFCYDIDWNEYKIQAREHEVEICLKGSRLWCLVVQKRNGDA